MKCIVVFADPSISAGVIPEALLERATAHDIDAFAVMLWLPRSMLRRRASRRFWRRANARLDELLDELGAAQILADGIVADEHAGATVARWLDVLRPRAILVSRERVPRRWIGCLESELDNHVRRAVARPTVSWLTGTRVR